jgi:hypothetical protein
MFHPQQYESPTSVKAHVNVSAAAIALTAVGFGVACTGGVVGCVDEPLSPHAATTMTIVEQTAVASILRNLMMNSESVSSD